MTFRAHLKVSVVAFICTILPALPARAHPMGNFSINHYARIEVHGGEVELRYILDLAEIPTYQEMQRAGITADSGAAATERYVAEQSVAVRQGLQLRVAGRPLALREVAHQILFSAGAGGLLTMKLGFTFRALVPRLAGTQALEYEDENFRERTGWKEIVCEAGTLQSSSGCHPERSHELSSYPTDLINSPPQDTEARLFFKVLPMQSKSPDLPARVAAERTIAPERNAQAPAAAPALKPNPAGTPRSAFTALITRRDRGLWFFVFAALVALGLGALHALEPGHGKTMVAAYLVGSHGTPAHAVLLGLVVTAAHTAGVYLLGAVTLCASRYFVPDQLYPWLGLTSGLMIAGLGVFLFLQRWSGESLEHDHTDAAALHSHWFLKPSVDARAELGAAAKNVTLKQLLVLGITGGMIPCPAALVVMLSAVSLRRIGFGLFLIVAFSAGLAAVLIAVGLTMVYARRWVIRWRGDSQWLRRWLPLASAVFITALGCVIGFRGLAVMQLRNLFPAAGWGGFLLTVAVGFMLGIRHSSDPDHVVAVGTILSRQPSVRKGAMIGAVWGLGHTLTIFLVGSAIILFRISIPPRLGLGMEFMVAVMLILLGILNLTGLLPRLRSGFFGADREQLQQRMKTATSRHILLRSLAVGIVHGLAGSAAVALLVLATIPTPGWAICYLLVFGLGTIAGMTLMTSAICLPLTWRRFAHVESYVSVCSGIVSVAFGGFLVYQIGYVGRLFATHPIWTPR